MRYLINHSKLLSRKGRPILSTGLIAALSFVVVLSQLLVPLKAHAASSPTTLYPDVEGAATAMTKAPDGTIWFAEECQLSYCADNFSPYHIAHISTSGAITRFPMSTAAGVNSMVAGPDGAIWFTESTGHRAIGRMSLDGQMTEFPIPVTSYTGPGTTPEYITLGPDGAMWFTDSASYPYGQSSIGRITMSGDITLQQLPQSWLQPRGIATGADGALWFLEPYLNRIGRLTTDGQYNDFSLPNPGPLGYSRESNSITAGQDGALWFTEADDIYNGSYTNYGHIGRIAMDGAITEYATPNNVPAEGITTGSDGNIWYGEPTTGGVASITPSGVSTEYLFPDSTSSYPSTTAITSGPDGNIWFGLGVYVNQNFVGRFGKIDLQALSTPSAPANLTAQSPTQTPSLSWDSANNATSYNVYRNGVSIGTSTTTAYTDASAPEGANSYYVTAVSASGKESDPGNAVNVLVDRTAPTITASLSPAANTAGWNNSQVTVTFNCSDTGSGVASCSSPATLFAEGTNQTISGTATDNAGNTASVTSSSINIDLTPPTLGVASWSSNPIDNTQSTSLNVPVTDNLSGVIGGEYYIGSSDPGQSKATPMVLNNGTLSASFANLAAGTYAISYRAEDAAANWDTPTTTQLTVKLAVPTGLTAMSPTNNAPVLTWNAVPTATTYQIWRQDTNTGTNTMVGTSATTNFTDSYTPGVYNYTIVAQDGNGTKSQPSVPFQVAVTSTAVSNANKMTAQGQSTVVPTYGADLLPGLAANNTTKATFDFSLGYPGGTFNVSRPLTFTFNAGGHKLFITSTSVDWLVVSGSGSSLGTFQGLASATLDNAITSNLPFTVTSQDGTRTTPASPDNFKLTVYTDSSRSTVLYSVNAQLVKGAVKIN